MELQKTFAKLLLTDVQSGQLYYRLVLSHFRRTLRVRDMQLCDVLYK